jgi:hypothetical protein
MGDEDAQILGLVSIVRPPHRLEQLAMRNRFAALRDEIAQKLKLLGRETDMLASRPNFPRLKVDV